MSRRGKVKKKNTYSYTKNRRKQWKKAKKQPHIECDLVRNAWDRTKSVATNLGDMGLSLNPNKTFAIPKTKELYKQSLLGEEKMEIEEGHVLPKKLHVVKNLESEAGVGEKRTLKLSRSMIMFCTYMLEKHGEDYKAMARDERNYYQHTPKQIRQMIRTFKSIPSQYNKYLEEKTTSAESSS